MDDLLKEEARKAFLCEFFKRNNFAIEAIRKDLSRRYYYRVKVAGLSYILMESDFPKEERFKEFMEITKILHDSGFRVAKIYDYDLTKGFILEEDLGDNLFNHHLASKPEDEDLLYIAALDVLLSVRDVKTANHLELQSDDLLLFGVKQFTEYFCKSSQDKEYIEQYFVDNLAQQNSKRNTMILRDFHADNLFWTKDGKVALIDYQDALCGYAAYDLVSLLQDARRYINEEKESEYLACYLAKIPPIEKDDFLSIYHLLSLQRNLRIYVLFIKAVQQRGLVKYGTYLPNVRNYLIRSCKICQDTKLSKLILSYIEAN